jgi:BirA family transcriptional regulator, biotin operon repressor / biotin---[acetyl-CoA-carboxylase] ligase
MRERAEGNVIVAEISENGAHDRSWPFVRTLAKYDVLDSTSDRASELVREGDAELPLAVWARTQARGRGRGTNSWWSDPGSLTFTLAIDPAAHGLTSENETTLALATAVAVIDALRELGLDNSSMGIRWPNDVEVGGRKLGGILPERLETNRGHRILIGVGINVFTRLDNAPGDVRPMATSLASLYGDSIDETLLPRLLSATLGRFESVVARLVNGDRSLPACWDGLDLLRDQWVQVDLGPRIIAGLGRGIDADGALCLDDGRQRQRLVGGRVIRTG